MKTSSVVGAVLGVVLKGVAIVVIVYLIYLGSEVCYSYGYRIFTEPAVTSQEHARTVKVTVTPEMSPWEIGKLFESRGLVRDAKLFVMQYYLSEYVKDVEPGVFELNTSMTAEEMMAAMVPEKTEEGEEEK